MKLVGVVRAAVAICCLMPSIGFAQSDTPKSASSVNQSGGVNAGAVGTVNIWPPLAQNKNLPELKKMYADGSLLVRSIGNEKFVTNEKVDDFEVKCDIWLNHVRLWLLSNAGSYASERFLFVNSTTQNYEFVGDLNELHHLKLNRILTNMKSHIVNLDLIMRDPSVYDK